MWILGGLSEWSAALSEDTIVASFLDQLRL
jgi:hypothetical protein